MKNNKPLRCPFCKSKLLQGEMKSYETLAEHVCNPNQENYPLRETLICTCDESEGVFWDDWGDMYSRNYKHRDGFTSAINSESRKSDKKFKRERIMRKYKIGKLILKLQENFYIWKYKERV